MGSKNVLDASRGPMRPYYIAPPQSFKSIKSKKAAGVVFIEIFPYFIFMFSVRGQIMSNAVHDRRFIDRRVSERRIDDRRAMSRDGEDRRQNMERRVNDRRMCRALDF